MAGNNWKKLTAQAAAGLSVHLDADQRRQHKHANADIDPNRADLNYSLGCNGYRDALQSARKRVHEVDAIHPPKRIKKDRITAVSIVTYCPEGIPEKEFFEALDVLFRERWGADYHGMQVHLDEVHIYRANDAYMQSRPHAHTLITPYATWRDPKEVNGKKYNEIRRGINGKHAVTKKAMSDLNKAVDDLCIERWGIHYMTGEKRKGKDTDTVKRDSLREEIAYLTAEQKKIIRNEKKIKKTAEILRDAINGTLAQLPDPALGAQCLAYLSGATIDSDILQQALDAERQRTRGRTR